MTWLARRCTTYRTACYCTVWYVSTCTYTHAMTRDTSKKIGSRNRGCSAQNHPGEWCIFYVSEHVSKSPCASQNHPAPLKITLLAARVIVFLPRGDLLFVGVIFFRVISNHPETRSRLKWRSEAEKGAKRNTTSDRY